LLYDLPTQWIDDHPDMGNPDDLIDVDLTSPPAGTSAASPQRQSPNHLLAALDPAEYRRLAPKLRTVPLTHLLELQRAGEPVRHVYFPGSGVCSVITVMRDGRMVEVGTIGREGVVNFGVFFAPDAIQAFSTIVQVPGDSAQVLSTDAFLEEMERKGELYQQVRRYAQAYSLFSMQATACTSVHSVEERCAKWLLMTHDRVGADRFVLTHEFFAAMLGVRRATVTVVAQAFQSAGLIQYARGVITIIDRERLKQASCECYDIVARQFGELLPG
jgi:CRP-like cAMP-binding protein